MRVAWFGALLVGAILAIAGCHAGTSGSLPSVGAPNGAAGAPGLAKAATGTGGTIVVVLPTIVPAKPLPTPASGNPYFLSAGTTSISGTFGKAAFGPIDISASSPNCTAAPGGGRSCTIQVQVAAGTAQLRMLTYGAKSSDGPLALMSKTRVKVLPGVLNYTPPLNWFGIAHGVKITATPKKLTQFKPAQVIVTVYGVDGSGAPIPEIALIDAATAGFGTVTTATGAYNQPLKVHNFTPTGWAYDGRLTGTETFTATASVRKTVVATASASVKIGPGNASTIGQIMAASRFVDSSSSGSIVEFTAAAVGNVLPLRTLSSAGTPYGAQDDGTFWMSTQRVDSIGDILGSIDPPKAGRTATASTVDAAQNEYVAYTSGANYNCQGTLHIWVFAANSYGATTTRNLVTVQGCSASELAVDGTGVLYAYVPPNYYGKTTGTVYEFAPNTSGNVPPALTISTVFLQNLVGDASGNLYAIAKTSSSAGSGTLVKYAPGSTTSVPVLPGVTVGGFALDAHANIYAEVPTSASTFQIEEFPAGSTTATRLIGGSNAGLVIPAGIAVMP